MPLQIELRYLLLDLGQVLVGQRECDPSALHFDDLLFDQGVFEDMIFFYLVREVKFPHRDLVAVQGVVLGHLGYMHLQVKGTLRY